MTNWTPRGGLGSRGRRCPRPKTGDLTAELLERLEGIGSSLLILNSVSLAPAWRGFGVGALLAGEALLTLEGDASCIATYLGPMDGSTGAARSTAVGKLGQVWAALGFRPFTAGVWVLDPAQVALPNAVESLRTKFETAKSRAGQLHAHLTSCT